MYKDNQLLEYFLRNRSSFVEILIIALIIGLTVNLASAYIIEIIKGDNLKIIIISIFLLLIALFYLFSKLFGKNIKVKNLEAFLVYDSKRNVLIDIPRYTFGSYIFNYINSAFIENKAFKDIWDRNPLSETFKNDNVDKNKSINIVKEAAEYFVISRLSIHLTDYFANKKFQSKNLKVYKRNDIPGVLFKNRFLELFSRPMEERAHFTDILESKNAENIVMSGGYGEPMYEKFELTLPQKSKIERINEKIIRIDTQRFILDIKTVFEGYNTVLPTGFLQFHLQNINSGIYRDFMVYKINIVIKVKFKFGRIFLPLGWEYYQWLDTFLNYLEECVSKNEFFDKIGWEKAYTLMKYLDSSIRFSKK